MRRTLPLVCLALAATTARAQVPTTTYNVIAYGARPDGQTDSTAAIQRAVDAAIVAAGKDGARPS